MENRRHHLCLRAVRGLRRNAGLGVPSWLLQGGAHRGLLDIVEEEPSSESTSLGWGHGGGAWALVPGLSSSSAPTHLLPEAPLAQVGSHWVDAPGSSALTPQSPKFKVSMWRITARHPPIQGSKH